ncbi:MAG: hypothetical protein G3M70_11055 [Candidatus Nitronauta litoralis]|uniref:Uncharacterized protein n=1 Tax=Candidatus Nitronauta litoralis TaxID=2705533 RepID=A0A7T0BXM0_9BACT|nr:MAG: hypothetical protein G3M70_11055 [Candidatus Nitronauta litoralis]
MNLKVEVSVGEFLDKMTILEIKSERIQDESKLANVRKELELLRKTWEGSHLAGSDISVKLGELKKVNEALWEIEDKIRVKESAGEFDKEFVELARSVYIENDKRASVKRELNVALGSDLIEEKSYADYTRKKN